MVCARLAGKNLFHRAIIQSGSALSSWGVATNPLRYARRLAAAVNCSTSDRDQSTDYIRCFKTLPAHTLVNAEIPGLPHRYTSALGPTVDRRTVLPSSVRSLVNKNVDSSVLATTPLLLGVTRDEGQIFLSQSDLDEVLAVCWSSFHSSCQSLGPIHNLNRKLT